MNRCSAGIFKSYQDEDQPAIDLHVVTRDVLRLFAGHNAGTRDLQQTILMMRAGTGPAPSCQPGNHRSRAR